MGELKLSFDALTLPAEHGLTPTVYSAGPGAPSEPRMQTLAERVYAQAAGPVFPVVAS